MAPLATRAVGVGPGDEVIVPSLTFVASANAILYQEANPVFVDVVSEDDLTVDPNAIQAPSPTHPSHHGHALWRLYVRHAFHRSLCGTAWRSSKMLPTAWASLDRRAAGAWGDIAAFSFFSNKNMAIGEGGMISTNDGALAEKCG